MNKDFFITISKKDFCNNIENIIKKTGKSIAPVIKSNAYGHGAKEIIKILIDTPSIDRVCVTYTNEADKIKKYGWKKQIMIMSPSRVAAPQPEYEYFLYSFEFLKKLLNKKGIHKVHIKINVGMHRFGFEPEEIDRLVEELIKHKKQIHVIGICTHLPRADYNLTDEINNQMKIFCSTVDKIKLAFPNTIVHPFSSKCIPFVEHFNRYCDFLRLGGSIYGLLNNDQKLKLDINLKQIITVKTKILSIRSVKENEYVGYGLKGLTHKPTKIAITSFGYGYGLLNNFSESYGLCNEEYIPVIGIICMNNIMFNINDLKKIPLVGNYITLTSPDHPKISAANISYHLAGGREYYFTASLHQDIKRYII